VRRVEITIDPQLGSHDDARIADGLERAAEATH
jgi:hypothetical protein